MKIYDITQELFHCNVYPGDEAPSYKRVASIASGDICNVTTLTMCAHNGTHVDSPYHFYESGNTIDEIPLDYFVGEATVVELHGEITKAQITEIMKTAKKRLLIKGDCYISLEAAKTLNEHGVILIGNESQTVGPIDAPAQVHYELLKKEVVLLEGLVLEHVPIGDYFLNCAPINLGGSDGAPCRAILITGVTVTQ